MCGFSGLLSLDGRAVDRELVRRMTRRLRHRGPDAGACCFRPRIGLGHRRLSIIDPAGGAQPMLNERGTVCLVSNSEIYNYIELRNELASAGVPVRGGSDTEVLLRMLEHRGAAALGQLEGMFALALWDDETERLLLARDPFGIKPLYYYEDGSVFLFASELKALLAYPALERELDLPAIDRYFESLALPEPRSVFRRVRKLPAGHFLTVHRRRVRLERYWTPIADGAQRPHMGGAPPERQLRVELERSVRLSLRSDVPVGVLLSGGVDSSALSAFAARACGGRLRTFSAVFTESDFDESSASRAVARHLGTEHHEVLVTSGEATRVAQRLVARIDEPFADASAVATSAVCRLASQHVKTVLSGEGADELFAGYPWHLSAMSGATTRDGHPARTIFGIGARRQLYSRRWREGVRLARRSRPLRNGDGAAVPVSPLGRALQADLQEYLPSDILFKSDRVSMIHSLEVRVPYLNRRLAEFVLSLPDSLKVRGRTQKYLLKRSAAGVLPAAVLRRPKKGFSIPMDLWLWQKGPWRELVYDTVFSARTRARDQFDMRVLARMQREHDRLESLHGYRLWTVFVLEAWQRRFLDPDSA